MISGVLVVDKPQGPTSHDMVARGAPRARRAPDRALRHARSDGHRRAGAGGRPGHAAGAVPVVRRQGLRRGRRVRPRHQHLRRHGDTVAESPDRPTREALVAALDRVPRHLRADCHRPTPPRRSAASAPTTWRGARTARTLDLKPVMVTVSQLDLLAFDGDRATLRDAGVGRVLRALAGPRPGRGAGHGRHARGPAPDARRRLRAGGRGDGRDRGDERAPRPWPGG